MSDVVIIKDETGRLTGLGDKGLRAYEKFRRTVAALMPGETMKFAYRLPRSPKHHAYFFVKLQGLLARQERFDDMDHLLAWLKVGAGFADLVPGHDGVPVALPRSISWESMEENDFMEFHKAMNDFLWTHRAMDYLWPHLRYEKQYQLIELWHREFERT